MLLQIKDVIHTGPMLVSRQYIEEAFFAHYAHMSDKALHIMVILCERQQSKPFGESTTVPRNGHVHGRSSEDKSSNAILCLHYQSKFFSE